MKDASACLFQAWFLWFDTAKITTIISLLLLSMISWVEMFSTELTEMGRALVNGNIVSSGNHDHMLDIADKSFKFSFQVPIILLLMSFPINAYLHNKYVQDEDNTYALAHGVLSAVFPAR